MCQTINVIVTRTRNTHRERKRERERKKNTIARINTTMSSFRASPLSTSFVPSSSSLVQHQSVRIIQRVERRRRKNTTTSCAQRSSSNSIDEGVKKKKEEEDAEELMMSASFDEADLQARQRQTPKTPDE